MFIKLLLAGLVWLGMLMGWVEAADQGQAVELAADIVITADTFELDGQTNTFIAQDNVKVVQKDVIIKGDKAQFDKQKNVVELFGNISLQKGDMRLFCSRVKAYGVKEEIHAFDDVKIEYDDINGTCEKAVYDVALQRMKLLGNSKAWQNSNKLSGQVIHIDLVEKKIQTLGKANIELSL